MKKPVVLLSPLDWGLGHTVRCIPMIRELIALGCTVIIACNSVQKALLAQEFPHCTYVHLPGYDLRYGKKRWSTPGQILLQLPKLLIKINYEHRWLHHFMHQQAVDVIISDNRFGLYTRSVPTVFITHQLHIKTGLGKIADHMAQWWNYRRIARFTTCWVPDYKGQPTMAGELSNPRQLPGIPIRYIGALSRLQACSQPVQQNELLIILSGPEPQRTIFENQLLQELKNYPAQAVLVRGLPQTNAPVKKEANVTIYHHAPAALLNKLICEAAIVISRSGYTTVMDLLKLGKKSILIPTPGQAEQEYLARFLLKQQLAYTAPQADFSLKAALGAAHEFPFIQGVFDMEEYKAGIRELIESL